MDAGEVTSKTYRKDRNSSRVQETFYLFFNSTPPADARITFKEKEEDVVADDKDTATAESDSKSKMSEIPEGYVQVRGSGTNQFGTFEIMGGYNLKTGVLSCQRIYITTVEETEIKKPQRSAGRPPGRPGRPVGRPRKRPLPTTSSEDGNAGEMMVDPESGRRSYFTRKKPVSWRKSGYDSGDEEVLTPKRRTASMGDGGSGSGRKRPRLQSEPSIPSPEKAVRRMNNELNDIEMSDATFSSPKITVRKNKSPPQPHQIGSFTSPPPTKKISKSKVREQDLIVIPQVGDPKDARWRAAHYLVYHRRIDEPTDDDQSNGANGHGNHSSSSPTPFYHPAATSNTSGSRSASSGNGSISYAVYEGEMNIGNNQRDGKGVCLYNNGTIYEGEWRRNKEHGRGILLTDDRRRIIYVGDWERGKMHGQGTYYYHTYLANYSEDPEDAEKGGVYRGDFKENTRHGTGTYTLPNGCSYSGDWRENLPSGRGAFYWTDGSVYNGQWKDGKRHGYGTLQTRDGFKYEGNWSSNGMEGRGIAIYPSGQRYEGMWAGGKKEGRGTITFGNGFAVYEGRFRDDCMEGQGTLKMSMNVEVPKMKTVTALSDEATAENVGTNSDEPITVDNEVDEEQDFMIPIEFQSDIGHIHQKAGFTTDGD